MNEMRKLMETIVKIDEDFGNAPDVRKATNKLHELMDEQMLDPRAVADAALKYMSEDDVAEMSRINELVYDEDDFDESVEQINADVHPSENRWPHDKPFPKKPSVSSDLDTSEGQVEHYLEASAQWLAKEAIELAGEVYDSEGPGEGKFATGAKSRDEYVRIAAPRFLDKDYKKAVIIAFQTAFDEAVSEQITGGHAWSPSGGSE